MPLPVQSTRRDVWRYCPDIEHHLMFSGLVPMSASNTIDLVTNTTLYFSNGQLLLESGTFMMLNGKIPLIHRS